jgi:uncharacterized protein (TIRG00374 family)
MRRLAGWLTMPALLVATAAVLVLAVQPRTLVSTVSRIHLPVVLMALAATLAVYLAQGVRWHQLLRAVGARLHLRDSLLLNAAGQTVTAIVPLGDLTRAVFASQASGTEVGHVVATVTVQELAYTLLLVLSSLPVLLELHLGFGAVLLVVAGVAMVLVILIVEPVYRVVRDSAARLPLLGRLVQQLDGLHESTAELLRRPETLRGTLLDAARAALSITVLWLIVRGLEPGALGWWQAAFVMALSYVGGAMSLVPGGAGASEAGMVGLLLLVHVDPATATAAALIQRVLTTGVAAVIGGTAYLVARRRLPLGSLFATRARGRSDTNTPPPALPTAA